MPEATHWPADLVERRPIDSLTPYDKNARTHSPEQIAQLAQAMQQWGWTNPVLIDEAGVIIAGHGRVEAAKSLGFTEVPVMIAKGWSDDQKKAYALADNQLAMNAGWNMELLVSELNELTLNGFDTQLIAFSQEQLQQIDAGVFQPNLNPTSANAPVTGAEVADTASRLAVTFTNAGKQEIADIMCPHCGHEFGVRKAEL